MIKRIISSLFFKYYSSFDYGDFGDNLTIGMGLQPRRGEKAKKMRDKKGKLTNLLNF